MTLDLTTPASWPVLMTVDEVAQVYRLKPRTIQDYAARGNAAIPAPSERRPYRWQRTVIARDVEPLALRRVG